jgi:hypothetical protein
MVEQDVRASIIAASIKYGNFFMALLSVCFLLVTEKPAADPGV